MSHVSCAVFLSVSQDSDLEAVLRHMEDVLEETSDG